MADSSATNKAIIPVLITMMLLTGVCNTLLTKYQDMICVENCEPGSINKPKFFEQPVLQTAQMFVGESGCWLLVAIFAIFKRASKSRGYTAIPNTQEEANAALKPLIGKDGRRPLSGAKVLLLSLPSTADIIATTLMNGGFLFVAASIYQMTRGALVLFVGLFSVIFLKRRLLAYQWLALIIVFSGVGLVGVAGSLNHAKETNLQTRSVEALLYVREEVSASGGAGMVAVGIMMIAGAQIFTATQFVLEEYILERYSIEPLKMVGWEGLFGFIVTVAGMAVLHILIGRSHPGGPFDAVTGVKQMLYIPGIGLTSVLIMISIGGFNFFGLSVTRTVSATSRSTIDTCRTLFIWIVSLGLGWEKFSSFTILQVIGFALLVYGTFLFNDIVGVPWACCVKRHLRQREEALLQEEPVEHH